MRKGDGLMAKFVGGPADGMTLRVSGTEVWIAVIDEKPVEYPKTPVQEILRAADEDGWTQYRVDVPDGIIAGDPTKFVPA